MVTQVKEEVTMYKGNGGQVVSEAADVVEKAMQRKSTLIHVAKAVELSAIKTQGPQVDVPEAQMEGFNAWLDEYTLVLANQAERYVQRQTEAQMQERQTIKPAIGEPTVGPYVAWDVLSLSPIELLSFPLPANAPNKILRGTNGANVTIAVFLAILWTNPVVDVANGFAVPPTIQLGGRTARVSFDQLNLTTATAGPNFTFNIPLPAPVPPLIVIPAFFITPTVTSPELFELNVTADIIESPQPYSAFATWHSDIDNEPSWFGNFPPPTGPQLQHDTQNRYMVYPF
ncbi:MAG: hypothetical protein HF973_16770 [Chloroflexi bacterium]|nr:hypothetical protein [Chloroflexota bacterium]